MKTFTTEVVIDSEVEFKEAGSKAPMNAAPHQTPDIIEIRAYAYTTIKALQQALEQAQGVGRLNDQALVRIDVFAGLSEREKETLYIECCHQTAVNASSDTDH